MPTSVSSQSLNFNTPLQAIKQAETSILERADRISSSLPTVDDVVGLKTDLYSIQANKAVIKVMDKVQSSILDILA